MTNSQVLLRELRAMGYTGGRTILKDFVRLLRPPRPTPATVRFETEPGEQAQVDLTPVTLVRADETTQQLWAFAMVLDWSRAAYLEFTTKADLPSFLRCHVHAFHHVGGVPRRILYDNTKRVVTGRDQHGQPVWNLRFLDFALRIGFDPRTCQPYRAQTKGKVERFLRYAQENFVPSAHPTDLEDLNRQAVLWCVHVADRRIHSTTHEQPAGRLEQERRWLQPLPPAERVAPFLRENRKVGRDGFVVWQGSAYGVPRIAVHPRAHAPGQRFIWPGQWDGLPATSPRRRASPVIVQVLDPGVEVRPLTAYEALLGVVNGHGRP